MLHRIGDCVLDTQRRELRCRGIIRPIEPQVYDLLRFLIENRDRVVTRDEIFQAVWRGRIVSDSALATRINEARAAIGDDGTQQRLIRTLRRNGFRFVGEVHSGEADADAYPKTILPSPRRRVALALKDAPAIVVLPVACIGERGERSALADGLTEEIICALYKFDWLLVISQHSSLTYDSATHKLRQVAQKFGAQYLLQVSVRQEHNAIRVVARLVDNAGNHLWAELFNCNIAPTFRNQSEIADRVGSAVSDYVFAVESIRVKMPKVPTAWEAVIGAATLMAARKKQHVAAARTLLNKAISTDPKSAPTLALSSFASTLGVHLGWHSRKRVLPRALDAAERALALDSENAWAHLALGYAKLQLANRPDEAIDILQNALALNPNLAMAHYFIALASSYLGRAEEAFEHADQAERLQPYDLLTRGNPGAVDTVRATASFVAGRYAQGITFAKKAISQNSGQVPAYRQIVTNSAMAGQMREAEAALRALNRLASNTQTFIDESETIWAHKENYRTYTEAFRMAGHRAD